MGIEFTSFIMLCGGSQLVVEGGIFSLGRFGNSVLNIEEVVDRLAARPAAVNQFGFTGFDINRVKF